MAMLDETRRFVAEFGTRHGLADDDVLRLQLIVEELFTNTVTHGYGGECDAPIALALAADAGRVMLRYEDAAHRYDPLATLAGSRATLAAAVEERPLGRLGVPLVAGLVDDVRYAFEGGRNRLRLVLRVTT